MSFIPPRLILGTLVMVVGTVFLVVGTATTSWMTLAANGYHPEVTYGLFKGCVEHVGCTKFPEDKLTKEAKVTQAFAILSVLASGCAMAVCGLIVLGLSASKPTPKALRILFLMLSVAAFICMIITVAVYASKIYIKDARDVGYKLGYSFGIFIAGGVLSLIGVLFTVGTPTQGYGVFH